MFVGYAATRRRRRGVVLILILAMLALLALIGVTFATFSGQAKINARNFSEAQNTPESTELMDYALSQLIEDTANPMSAIRGHSLVRDMYGNDAYFNGALTGRPFNNAPMMFSSAALVTPAAMGGSNVINGIDTTGLYKCVTNISNSDQAFYGFNFARWIVRFPAQTIGASYYVATTYEIIVDDSASAANRIFYLAPADLLTDFPSSGGGYAAAIPSAGSIYAGGYASPDSGSTQSGLQVTVTNSAGPPPTVVVTPPTSTQFVLDGRYLHAFNGTGVGGLGTDGDTAPGGSHSFAQYANFRYNGNVVTLNPASPYTPTPGDPDTIGVGMDEDYDACDLENWFLAIQSADGHTIIPSFHRPGILTASDWSLQYNTADPDQYNAMNPSINYHINETRALSKILRPRAIDHNNNQLSFPDLVPNSGGSITYDIDNDGNGSPDSVWLDLGYPTTRNNQGQLYKPLFAFMVVGLNGRIPLNTAGNLQLHDASGNPLFTHASHLGNSPSELDPTYALQNDNAGGQSDNAGFAISMTQLRNLLAGTFPQVPSTVQPGINYNPPSNYDSNTVTANGQAVYLPNNMVDSADYQGATTTIYPAYQGNPSLNGVQPVPGRWGEPDNIDAVPGSNPSIYIPAPVMGNPPLYANAVRAGLSQLYNSTSGYGDARDDNRNTYDSFNGESPAGGYPADYLDSSGSLYLPVERLRRFVSPIDAAGDGIVGPFNAPSSALGPDLYGRVAYFKYFRPPGIPVATAGANAGSPPSGTPFVDVTNNLLHGYESNRNPAPSNANMISPFLLAGMPWDNSSTAVPTFTNEVNSNLAQFIPPNPPNPDYSPNLDEADEMNLYNASSLDQPFGPSDLEWLYRVQDTDGSSLSSRLQQLAPISFYYASDAKVRRRLFSIDSWEPTTFAWTNDNPVDPSTGALNFANNSRFSQGVNADFLQLPGTVAIQPYSPSVVATPSLAHRGRKINLNLPLPVSNSPVEPIRQKWIRETYELLKVILPPHAVDTAQELAQLSQFVVNVIDFRDPDCTATRFVNTDLLVTPATTTTAPTLAFNTVALTWTEPATAPATGTRPVPPQFSPEFDTLNSQYLVQFGMEYSPVAINEVLAYQMQTKQVTPPAGQTRGTVTPEPNDFKRMYVELVNTLLADASAGASASSLSLLGWDFVVMPDDPTGRPDPYTGQIPLQGTVGNIDATKILAVRLDNQAIKPPPPPMPPTAPTAPVFPADAPLTTLLTALSAVNGANANVMSGPISGPDTQAGTVYYNVFGLTPPAQKASTGNLVDNSSTPVMGVAPITISNQIDLITNTLLANQTFTANKYYWIYLRRPANPFDTSYYLDYNAANQPRFNPFESRVVVDCFRFIFHATQAYGATNPVTMTDSMSTPPTGEFMYSLQRLQPNRGGHAVPPIPAAVGAGNYGMPAYGYSEQVQPATIPSASLSATPAPLYGQFGMINSTTEILHSLGSANIVKNPNPSLATPPPPPSLNPPPRADNTWDFVPFHDRDFTSVAELMLVPGCPPGLFTKQFVELAPPMPGTITKTPQATAPNVKTNPTTFFPTVSNSILFDPGEAPHTYPYLIDHFWYSGQATTGAETSTWPTPPTVGSPGSTDTGVLPGNLYVGGPTGAGWFKMFEFFEVPSTANGSIGSVANGLNYDWMRQDFRPGLINLNMIIDEEVFFALMSETNLGQAANADANYANFGNTRLNVAQGGSVPKIVTQVGDVTMANPGGPTYSYAMSSRGFTALDPTQTNAAANMAGTPIYGNKMKAAFADFLMLRGGGSGFLYGYGNGTTGSAVPLAAERPYHSLSYPDINLTVMRPAWLPPSATSTPPATTPYPTPWSLNVAYVDDPGHKNPYFFLANNPAQPEPIPPRRLFQIPDSNQASNASHQANAANTVSTPVQSPALNRNTPDLTPITTAGAMTPPNVNVPNVALGGLFVAGSVGPPAVTATYDFRQSPYFRTEWLQKVTNLTTVRTHQYAVWITVGFFEVLTEGQPLLANTAKWNQAYDTLGNEVGLLQGKNVRYRSFFVIDRTKATGFNPLSPGNFRDCVLYRQNIE